MSNRIYEIQALIANYDTAEVLEALLEDYLENDGSTDVLAEDMIAVLIQAIKETKFIYANAEDA